MGQIKNVQGWYSIQWYIMGGRASVEKNRLEKSENENLIRDIEYVQTWDVMFSKSK